MKTKNTLLVLAVSSLLMACGSSGDGNQAASPSTPSGVVATGSTDFFVVANARQIPTPPAGKSITPPTQQGMAQIDIVVQQVNQLRAKQGLSPLVVDPKLSAYAQLRAEELVKRNSHTRPNGEGPFKPIKTASSGNLAVGENIAAGYTTGASVFKGWKDSPGHYKNMVGASFTKIGVGLYIDPNTKYGYHWVQIFSNDNGTTAYSFAQPIPSNLSDTQLVGIRQHLQNNVQIDATGKVSLNNTTPSTVDNDVAKRAYAENAVSHSGFADGAVMSYQGVKIVLRDPKTAGWSYQTFGEIIDNNNNPLGYVNVGNRLTPADNQSIKANYKGIAQGSHAANTRVVADVTAAIDFSPNAKRNMSVSFSNSHSSTGNSNFIKDARFDFNANLNWSATDKQFTGQGVTAAMYGNEAQEIGGQFNRQVESNKYQGAFAGKKQ